MKKARMNLQTKIIILSTLFSIIVILILAIYFAFMITSTLEKKIGENALNLAKTIAVMPQVQKAFATDHPEVILQPLAESIRKEVGAEFIVIGNEEGIRYSHPLPDRLGKKMVGGDNDGVLKEGKAYISKAIGTLGPSLRGKAPIRDQEGQVIGVVSVGFLLEDIKELEQDHIIRIIGIIFLVLFIGALGSFYLSWNIKKDIFGLEPKEISQLFLERQTILESVKEGIIAVDSEGKISVINDTAKKLILKEGKETGLVGQQIQTILPNTKIMEVIATGNAQYDQEMVIGNEIVVTNRIPMIVNNGVIGAVASFRRKTEIDHLLQELTDYKINIDTLRSQNHEFTNKLYTIFGLLQLDKVQDAIQFITDETLQQDEMIDFLMDHIHHAKLTAFFIGKITRANEQRVKLLIDSETEIHEKYLTGFDMEDLITIYGNLIENALDSVRYQAVENRKIHILLKKEMNHLLFIVEDWGLGIPQQIREQIFKDGFTTKGEQNRGIGLSLVDSLVKKYYGDISFYEASHQGVIFEVKLPLKIIDEEVKDV